LEKWGGTAFVLIDPDVENSSIVAGTGAKSYAYSYYPTIDYPGAVITDPSGINDIFSGSVIDQSGKIGQVVGTYYDGTGTQHGFLYDIGYTSIDYPGAYGTGANGINNGGSVVGGYTENNPSRTPHGFLYQNGSFNVIDFPGALATSAQGINDAGQIIGNYEDASGKIHGFFYVSGLFQSFDDPASTDATGGAAINGFSQVVGGSSGPNLGFFQGFLETYAGATTPIFQTFDYPGADISNLFGINNNGQIVGNYTILGGAAGGFLYDGANFVTVTPPGASSSNVFGLNDYGQIVGNYSASGTQHGFAAVVP
jgi:probable HAF family extracellular repeat protein